MYQGTPSTVSLSRWLFCAGLALLGGGEAAGKIFPFASVPQPAHVSAHVSAQVSALDDDILQSILSPRMASVPRQSLVDAVYVDYNQVGYPIFAKVDNRVVDYTRVQLLLPKVRELQASLARIVAIHHNLLFTLDIGFGNVSYPSDPNLTVGVIPHTNLALERVTMSDNHRRLVFSFTAGELLSYLDSWTSQEDSNLNEATIEIVFAKCYLQLPIDPWQTTDKALVYHGHPNARLGEMLSVENAQVKYSFVHPRNGLVSQLLPVENAYTKLGAAHFNQMFLEVMHRLTDVSTLGKQLISKIGQITATTSQRHPIPELRTFPSDDSLNTPTSLAPTAKSVTTKSTHLLTVSQAPSRNLAYSIIPSEVLDSQENYGSYLFSHGYHHGGNSTLLQEFDYTRSKLQQLLCIAQHVWNVLYQTDQEKYAPEIKNVTEVLIPGINYAIAHKEDPTILVESLYYYVYHVLREVPEIADRASILYQFVFLNEPSLDQENLLPTLKDKIAGTEKVSEVFRQIVLGQSLDPAAATAPADQQDSSATKHPLSDSTKQWLAAQKRFRPTTGESTAVGTTAKKVVSVLAISAASVSLLGTGLYVAMA